MASTTIVTYIYFHKNLDNLIQHEDNKFKFPYTLYQKNLPEIITFRYYTTATNLFSTCVWQLATTQPTPQLVTNMRRVYDSTIASWAKNSKTKAHPALPSSVVHSKLSPKSH